MSDISPSCLNIDGSRVCYESEDDIIPQLRNDKTEVNGGNMYRGNSMQDSKTKAVIGGSKEGRYPSQLFVDSNCAKMLDEQSGKLKSGDIKDHHMRHGIKGIYQDGLKPMTFDVNIKGDIGGSSKILHQSSYTEEEIALINADKVSILFESEVKMKINQGKAEQDLTNYPDYYFNTIFGDPPYNLGTEWIIDTSGKVIPKGHKNEFMGKNWGVDWEFYFKECFRTLKHGGYMCLFSIDRQTLPLEYYASMAGFEICQHLYWYQIQGFPKNLDVSKAIDKRLGKEREIISIKKYSANHQIYTTKNSGDCIISNPSSDLAKKYEGYKAGIAPLKPCMEVILVFRKPTKNRSYIDDVMEHSDDISPSCVDIDKSRVGTDEELRRNAKGGDNGLSGTSTFKIRERKKEDFPIKGRYPSQLFTDNQMAEKLDEQSGNLETSGTVKSGKAIKGRNNKTTCYSKQKNENMLGFNDKGGCSKILHKCDYEDEELELVYYSPKVSGHERNAGCDRLESKSKTDAYKGLSSKCKVCGKYFILQKNFCTCNPETHGSKAERMVNPTFKNSHPTLKPMSLIYKLAKLFKLPIEDQKVYFPFGGAFSEVIGFLGADYNEDNLYVCELNEYYINIGKARMEYWKDNNYYFREDKKKQLEMKKKVKEKNTKVDTKFNF